MDKSTENNFIKYEPVTYDKEEFSVYSLSSDEEIEESEEGWSNLCGSKQEKKDRKIINLPSDIRNDARARMKRYREQ